MYNIPKDLKYSKDHEWVRMDGSKAIVGITDYAQQKLGDIVFVDLASTNESINQFEDLCVVESVKAASDVYSPLSGRVIEANAALEENPGIVNESPYEKGWLAVIEHVNETELANLMDANEYESYIAKEN